MVMHAAFEHFSKACSEALDTQRRNLLLVFAAQRCEGVLL